MLVLVRVVFHLVLVSLKGWSLARISVRRTGDNVQGGAPPELVDAAIPLAELRALGSEDRIALLIAIASGVRIPRADFIDLDPCGNSGYTRKTPSTTPQVTQNPNELTSKTLKVFFLTLSLFPLLILCIPTNKL